MKFIHINSLFYLILHLFECNLNAYDMHSFRCLAIVLSGLRSTTRSNTKYYLACTHISTYVYIYYGCVYTHTHALFVLQNTMYECVALFFSSVLFFLVEIYCVLFRLAINVFFQLFFFGH